MAAIAAKLGDGRDYYLFDSFEGLPEAEPIDGKKALKWQETNAVDNCCTGARFVKEAMQVANVRRYHVIPGWFENTLPSFRPAERIALLRLDADWYSSTAECLNGLYAHVRPKGLIIIDDYYAWDGCARAVHDFLSANNLADRIRVFENTVCFLLKTEDVPVKPIDPRPRS